MEKFQYEEAVLCFSKAIYLQPEQVLPAENSQTMFAFDLVNKLLICLNFSASDWAVCEPGRGFYSAVWLPVGSRLL